MTKDEALAFDLALEALESLFNWKVDPERGQRCSEAVAAIKKVRSAPTSADYAMGYAEGFNDGCKPAPVQEPDEWLTGCPECGMDSGCDCDSGTWNPPVAPVQEPIGGATVYVHQSDDKGDVLGERWKAAHVKFKDGFLEQFAQGAKFDLYITPPADGYDKVLQAIKEARPAVAVLKDKPVSWWVDRFEEFVKQLKEKNT
jgi:hypothetical protein